MRLRNYKLALALSAYGASMAFIPNARAQNAQATYGLMTNDGSSYQGQLVENVVGQHVTIRLLSGEIHTFQASDVKSQGPVSVGTAAPNVNVVVPSSVVAPEPVAFPVFLPPPPGALGAPPVTYSGADAVQLHITKANSGEGRLFMESQSGWVPVCTMPCSTTIDPKIEYRLYDSPAFRFPSATTALDAVADTGGRGTFRAIGGTMTALSGVGVVLGALVAANVFSSGPTPNTPEEQNQASESGHHVAAGLGILGASAALLTAGIVFCALHPSSTLTTSTGVRILKRDSPRTPSVALTAHGFVF
jgi:hypothetical protein